MSLYRGRTAWSSQQNENVFAMIFTTRNAKTAPVVIGEMLGTVEGVQRGVIFAAATVNLFPA